MKLRAERALEFARKVGQVTHPGSTTSARSISEWGGFFIDLLIHLILCGQLENELNDLTDFVRDHATQLSDADYEKLENAQANLLNLYAENC
jgi:hypothetical protein